MIPNRTIICRNCGTECRGSAYCSHCGTPADAHRREAQHIFVVAVLGILASVAGAVGACSIFLLADNRRSTDEFAQIAVGISSVLAVVAAIIAVASIVGLRGFVKSDNAKVACKNCGRKYPSGMTTCTSCGAPVARRKLNFTTISAYVALSFLALVAGVVATGSMVYTVQLIFLRSDSMLLITIPLCLAATTVVLACVRGLNVVMKR